jgi:hypothetical protein
VIPPASAVDAAGSPLPVSDSVSGDTLTTHVDLSGNVAFPVLVDPLMVGAYGEVDGANVWSKWEHADNCGCFGFPEYYNLIQAGTNPGPPSGDYGEWYIYAPGAGAEGGASITRVDVSGVYHQALNQSYIDAGIGASSGSEPIYSFDGYTGKTGPSPLLTGQVYSNQPMAFCAENGKGHDGGEPPLCNENYGGQYFQLLDELGPEARTVYNYVQMSGAAVTYLDNTAPNAIALNNVPSGWVKHAPPNVTIYAHDQGLGIAAFELEIPRL